MVQRIGPEPASSGDRCGRRPAPRAATPAARLVHIAVVTICRSTPAEPAAVPPRGRSA